MTDATGFRTALTAQLDALADEGRRVRFWWRDDDAIEPSPALDRLLALANAHDVDVALAVIPKGATEALAQRLADEPHAVVLQHGWRHKNHQCRDAGEKAAELGTRRDPDEALAELAAGRAKLETLFGPRFVPALVPPWNRISDVLVARAPDVGLPGLSTFTADPPPTPHRVQTHIDMIKWKKDRAFIGWDDALRRFEAQFDLRRQRPEEPIGILSHHLAQDDTHFAFLEETLTAAASHPATEWPPVRALFGL